MKKLQEAIAREEKYRAQANRLSLRCLDLKDKIELNHDKPEICANFITMLNYFEKDKSNMWEAVNLERHEIYRCRKEIKLMEGK